MKLPIENNTELNISSAAISFSDDIFQDEDSMRDPIFCEVRDVMEELKESAGKTVGISLEELDDLKMEKYLTESELKQWKKLSGTNRQRILRKVHNSQDYRRLKEIVACCQLSAAHQISGLSYRNQAVAEQPKDAQNIRNQNLSTEPVRPQNIKAEDVVGNPADQNEILSMPGGETASLGDGAGLIPQGVKAVKKAAEIFKEERQFIPQEGAGKQAEQSVKRKIGKSVTEILSVVSTGAAGPAWIIFLMAAMLMSFILIPLLAVLLDAANTPSSDPGVMPYYAQADYPMVPFDQGTIQSSGCGITSMAMVASLLKGETITPPMLAEMAGEDASYNTVRSHRAIHKFAEYYGLGEVEEMGGPSMNCCGSKAFDPDYIKEKIAGNCPVIASVTGGYYNPSGGGHYLALYGSGKGGVFVYDPGSRSRYTQSLKNDGSDWNEVFSHAKHIWIFQPYSVPDYIDSSDGTNCMTVYLHLKQAGFSDAAASGVIGNMWQECAHGSPDLRPGMESAGGSIGLLQWSGGRRTSLQNLAGNRNSNWMDISVQIEYLLQEINSGSQWIWTPYAARHYPAENNLLLEQYKQLEDPQRAAEVFCAKFTRPDYEKSNLPYRKEMAYQFYLKIVNH